MADAEAGRETDLVLPQHPFAQVFSSDLWGHTMTLVAVGLMMLAFFEHAPHVPDRSNPRFSWVVGSIEAVLLLLVCVDQYMRTVAELFVRPCGGPRRPWADLSKLCGCTYDSFGTDKASSGSSGNYVQLEEGLLQGDRETI